MHLVKLTQKLRVRECNSNIDTVYLTRAQERADGTAEEDLTPYNSDENIPIVHPSGSLRREGELLKLDDLSTNVVRNEGFGIIKYIF